MIQIVTVGKIKEKSLKSLLDEYEKRLSAYTKLQMIEVDDEPSAQENSDAQNEIVKTKEGERILSKIKNDAYVIALDLKGKMIDSLMFSQQIQDLATYGKSDLCFVVGGSLGLSESVMQRANYRWKLSDLTFPHNLAKLLLLEQLYRAYRIARNQPYHK